MFQVREGSGRATWEWKARSHRPCSCVIRHSPALKSYTTLLSPVEAARPLRPGTNCDLFARSRRAMRPDLQCNVDLSREVPTPSSSCTTQQPGPASYICIVPPSRGRAARRRVPRAGAGAARAPYIYLL